IKSPKYIEVQVVHYFPWDLRGEYQLLPNGQVKGTGDSAWQYTFWTNRKGDRARFSGLTEKELGLAFSMEKKNSLYFIAGVDTTAKILENHIYRYKNEGTIDSILKDEEKRYKDKRVKVERFNEGIAEAVSNNLLWMTLYQPGKHRFYTPAGRRWIFPRAGGSQDHWTIFEWDSFFNALELSLESTKQAVDVLKSVLETQYPNGNIPNWKGRFGGTPDRSQPPVGSYVTLKLFQKTGQMEILEFAYPFLKKWHSFWKTPLPDGRIRRDGNGDGLLEWGSDSNLVSKNVPPWEENASGKQRAMWESGQDDLPNWDDTSFNRNTGTLTMNCLDLNSLYTLDAWCLAQIAIILGNRADHAFYMKEYEEMKNLINQHLWDEREEFYFDWHWDGRFSSRKAASNFYPLLAGIPDSDRAMKMVKKLLNPDEYWGEYVIPTISRNDPAFKDQQYWRGAIWPPINYLVYQGLKAYRFDAVAYELAKRSASMFMRTWEHYQLCPENFDSRTGEAGGQRFQSWGPLFALIGVEEYMDFTPWEGFRFGMLKPENKGRLERLAIQGRHYELKVYPSVIELKEEGKRILKSKKSAVFRHFLYSENEVSFEIKSLDEVKVKLWFLIDGKYQLRINDQIIRVFDGKSVDITVPAGDHSVLVWLLQKKT
ncbi:MAG: amylo-alpha-1,6-glucosidase, partial [Acidobacteriota bacterium]